MTKFFTTLLLIVGVYSTTSAQTKNNIEFGANIGYNGAYVVESNLNTSSVNGFNVGVSADYYFSDRWSIKGKLVYDQKGWGDGFINTSNQTMNGVDFKLTYLTVPVMANWHFGKNRNWYLNFGPYVGFLMNAKENALNTDIKSVFNTTDAGLDLGIGIKFPVCDKAKIFIEYDGQAGVTDIFKQNPGSSVKNSRSSINVGVNFSLD